MYHVADAPVVARVRISPQNITVNVDAAAIYIAHHRLKQSAAWRRPEPQRIVDCSVAILCRHLTNRPRFEQRHKTQRRTGIVVSKPQNVVHVPNGQLGRRFRFVSLLGRHWRRRAEETLAVWWCYRRLFARPVTDVPVEETTTPTPTGLPLAVVVGSAQSQQTPYGLVEVERCGQPGRIRPERLVHGPVSAPKRRRNGYNGDRGILLVPSDAGVATGYAVANAVIAEENEDCLGKVAGVDEATDEVFEVHVDHSTIVLIVVGDGGKTAVGEERKFLR